MNDQAKTRRPTLPEPSPLRRSYKIRPSDWRRRPPNPQFCDRPPAAPEFDDACWLETASGAALAIRTFADHHEDADL
jgi:hypothetical protein